ncbi:MAG: thiamine phosphate synthase [Clostridia bacterium]|nr:thiamine phosphate synthase [Clostridia bacterium]
MLKSDLLLYLVTDRNMCGEHLESVVETAIKNGVTMVQLREKEATFEEFCERALKMKAICNKYNVPLIINDMVDVCLAVDADGVHLGSCDCDISKARELLGKNKIIGASSRDIKTAKLAQNAGADYLGVGAVFGTKTKLDAKTISVDTLKEIANCVNIPVVAIGGISTQNICELKGSGIAGVAVVSSILKAQDVKGVTKDFISKLAQIIY